MSAAVFWRTVFYKVSCQCSRLAPLSSSGLEADRWCLLLVWCSVAGWRLGACCSVYCSCPVAAFVVVFVAAAGAWFVLGLQRFERSSSSVRASWLLFCAS
ncbi:hypothetical protein U1Q18_015709 [Sarracenia purpurea var. burkii]